MAVSRGPAFRPRDVAVLGSGAILGIITVLGLLVTNDGICYQWSTSGGNAYKAAKGKLLTEIDDPATLALAAPLTYPRTHTIYSKPTFKDSSECGFWQDDYINLHRDITAGKSDPRYAVVYCTRGLADCLKGSATIFWYAVLTRRAFQMHLVKGNKYEWAFGAPNVNWTFTAPFPSDNLETTLVWNVTLDTKNRFLELFRAKDVTTFGEEYKMVYFNTGWGASYRLPDNPYHRDRLRMMGLRPETMFGCAMDFLLAPQPDLLDMFKAEASVMQDKSALKIGIQMRNPKDNILMGRSEDNATLSQFSSFFQCAKEVESSRKRAKQKVVWFVISDSVALRKRAVKKWPQKVLTNTDISVRHTSNKVKKNTQVQSFMAAAGELWLFSLADYHITSSRSGFGATAAHWSLKWHSRFDVDNVTNERRKCGIRDYDAREDRLI